MKLTVTYMTLKTVMVECNGMGTDNYPRCFAEKIPTESDIIDLVQKVEQGNSDELMIDWISEGTTTPIVTVQKID